MFKTPCERVIWKILPSIRKEMVLYMVNEEGISRKRVGKMLGLTQPALYNYIKGKRGRMKFTKEQKREIINASKRIVQSKKPKKRFEIEICNLCKKTGSGCS